MYSCSGHIFFVFLSPVVGLMLFTWSDACDCDDDGDGAHRAEP